MTKRVFVPPKVPGGTPDTLLHDEAVQNGVVLTREQRQEVRAARAEQHPGQLPGTATPAQQVQVAAGVQVSAAQNQMILEAGGVTCRTCEMAFIMNDREDMKRVAMQVLAADMEFRAEVGAQFFGQPRPEKPMPEPKVEAKSKAKPKRKPKRKAKAKAPAKPKAEEAPAPVQLMKQDPAPEWREEYTDEDIVECVHRGEGILASDQDQNGKDRDFILHLQNFGITERVYAAMVKLVEDSGQKPKDF